MEATIQTALGFIVGLVMELLYRIEKGLEDSGLVSRDASGVNFKRRR